MRASRGFTLLELILVLTIFAVVVGLAAPSLRNFWTGRGVQDSAAQLLSLTQWARIQAVSDAAVHRLNLDPAAGEYWLTVAVGQEQQAIGSEFGRHFALPAGQKMELLRADQQAQASVDFYPDGRCEPATIRLSDEQGKSLDIVCASPSERFRIQ